MHNKVVIIIFILLSVLSALVGCAVPEPEAVTNSSVTQSAVANQPAKQTSFRISDLQINPAEANPGEKISVTALVRNTDATEISYTAELKINGSVEEVMDLSIPSGETKPLNFLVQRDVPGLYNVVLGESSGQFLIVKSGESAPSTDPSVATSKLPPASDFSGIDVLNNKEVSLKQFKGSVVLLNFVNYGCSTSLNKIVSAQLMVIRDLKKERADFVPISIFCGCCPPEVLREFATKNNLNWTWILDTDNIIIPQYVDYIVKNGFPTLVFIDKNGGIKDITGYCDYFTLNNKINETL